jgi:hypothetical protein
MQRFAESSSGWFAQASLYGVLSLLNIESQRFFVRMSSARLRGSTSAVSWSIILGWWGWGPSCIMWCLAGGGREAARAMGAMPMARRIEVSFIVAGFGGVWLGCIVELIEMGRWQEGELIRGLDGGILKGIPTNV